MEVEKLEPLLKAQNVAEILGVSKSLAYRLIQTGEIPSIKFSASVRVRPSDLSQFIDAKKSSQDRITFRNN